MGKSPVESHFEELENGDMDLIIRVPWDNESLVQLLRNCDAEKNSVTLFNGDVVASVGRRGNNMALFTEIDGHRVEIKGGVNLYITRPSTAGKKASTYSKADARAIDKAEQDDSYKWAVLKFPLLSPDGSIFRKEGERILRDTLSDLALAGFKLMETPAKPEVPKHPSVSPAQANVLVAKGIDAKAKELGIADEAVFRK